MDIILAGLEDALIPLTPHLNAAMLEKVVSSLLLLAPAPLLVPVRDEMQTEETGT